MAQVGGKAGGKASSTTDTTKKDVRVCGTAEDILGGVMSSLEIEDRDPTIEFLLDERTKANDEFCSDLVFYLNNMHTFLSLFLSHRLHPYSKFFRVVVLLVNLCFSWALSAFVGYLNHVASPWELPVNFLIAPILMFLLERLFVFFATCDPVQRAGVRNLYRWGCTCLGQLIFIIIWFVLVPVFIIVGLSFASYKSEDDIVASLESKAGPFSMLDLNKIAHDFHPSWQLFVSWLKQTAIGLAVEFPLLLLLFLDTRYYGCLNSVEHEETECKCLRELQEEWLRDHDYPECTTPLMPAT